MVITILIFGLFSHDLVTQEGVEMVVTFHAKLLFGNLSKRITGFSDHSIKVRVVSFLVILTINSLLEVLWSIFSVSLVVNLSA